MSLKINSSAPNFTSPSTSQKNYSLKDSLGKYVVLYFYPKDDTPGCTIETNDFKAGDGKNFDFMKSIICLIAFE